MKRVKENQTHRGRPPGGAEDGGAPKAARQKTKRHMLFIIRDVAKLSVNSGDFGHNILSPKKL